MIRIGVSMAVLCLSFLADLSAQVDQPIHWKEALKQEPVWYAGKEAIRIADNVLAYQDKSGGWPKNIDMARRLSNDERNQIRQEQEARGSSPNNITIDNGATHTQMRYLARVFNSQGGDHLRENFQRGLRYLLEAQYDNGGWPQYFPLRQGYYEEITFNDDAMIEVLALFRDIAEAQDDFDFVSDERKIEIETALARGIKSILQMQIRQNGKLTVWCAQHDKVSLEPTWARSYEPPSLSGGESVGVVRFLMSIEKPSPEIISSIESAMDWFEIVGIRNLRYEKFTDEGGIEDRRVVSDPDAPTLWARFYELGNNRPIFLGRDSVVRYHLKEIEQERRAGYSYYGTWAATLLETEYPEWKAKHLIAE